MRQARMTDTLGQPDGPRPILAFLRRRGLTALAVLAVMAVPAACVEIVTEQAVPAEAGLEAPAHRDDGWAVADPVEAGLDAEVLAGIFADVEAGKFPNTHALLIERDGALVFERYFTGTDERWGEPIPERAFGPDDLHDLRSVSKSVTSALLGIALAADSEAAGGPVDFEAAVQRPVVDYLPNLDLAPEKRAITLHHVLTMTAGLAWNEMDVPYTDDRNDEIRTYDAEDPAAYVLGRPLEHEPGTTWYYSGGLTQVLASIIHELTGRTVDEYARDELFGPLGITEFEWLGPGTWARGNPAAMSGLRLRARDLAKIGSVYLHGGRWNGRQVVPEQWVEMSKTRHVQEIGEWSADGTRGYGYQWWVGVQPTGERWATGWGNGNQRLYVFPDEGLVVTIYAGEYHEFEGHSERLVSRVLAARRAD